MPAPRAGRLLAIPVALVCLGVLATVDGAAASAAPAEQAAQAAQAPAAGPLTLQQRFGDRDMMLGRSIVIGGLGSSVGAGATLPDVATQAPVAVFAADLEARVDPAGLGRWSVVNDSVGGSTIHDGVARDWAVLAEQHPDVVVLAYGMNDGAPAQFESGETYAGSMQGLAQLIGWIRDAGAIPVVLTTPSPHTGRLDLSSPPDPIAQRTLVDTTDPVHEVVMPGVGTTEESSRHAAINAGMRAVAAAAGADLIDVEPSWREASARLGQDALFDAGEFVHPNLLGHRLGYDRAIEEALRTAFSAPVVSGAPLG